MEEILLARKNWSNAAAFVAMNPENGNVFVYGKFYVEEGYRRRGYGGPITEVLDTVPAHLLKEAKNMSWNTPRSQELAIFSERVFTKAKETEPWFGY
jgi:GNAT superfamily N-acetyltransferase